MISAKSVKVSLHECHNTEPLAFRTLSVGTGQIQQLTLWSMDDWRCMQLHPISALTKLVLERCSGLSGAELQMHQNLTSLTFISCIHISKAGVRKMIKSCPSLQKIEFLAEHHTPNPGQLVHPHHGRLYLSAPALVALSRGEHLSTINLCGIHPFSDCELKALKACSVQVKHLP